MSKKSFFMGTFILAGAGIFSRFIGFFYRIFLSRTLGAAGIGIFQLAMPVQTLLAAISTGGIQTAISQLSASALALKDKQKAKDFFVIGTVLSFFISILLSLLLYQNADFVSIRLLHEPQTCQLLQIIACSFPLGSIHICINSYYYAQKETVIPSMIQLLEQFSRVLSTYLFYLYLVAEKQPVTPLTAGVGAFISELIAAAAGILALRIHFLKSHIRFLQFKNMKSRLKSLTSLAFPMTLNRILVTLLGSIEVILIPQRLELSGMNSAHALSVYGILSGMALPLILFPSTLTNSASVMLMPSITELQTLGNKKKLRYVILRAYQSVSLLGLLFALFFYFFGNFTGNLLYHNSTVGIHLRTLAFVCPFLYLNTTLASILNGLGKAGTSLLHNTLSICIRIFFVVYIIPKAGIQGYLYGVILSEILKTVLCSLSLCQFSRRN